MFQIQSKSGLKTALLLGAATATALSVSAPAWAADAVTETVIVTGSRIPQTGIYSSSPVQSIGQDDIKLKGASSVENILRELPSVFNDGDNSATNNASSGLATIDLHALTPARTLVLVDGKRLEPADFLGQVDLNQIPAAMIDRIEVLTGGASSVYGADAVAGVVNLILRKDFEGVLVDASITQPNHSDGTISTIDGIIGANTGDGKGNVTIYAGYQNRQTTFQGNRASGEFALASPDFNGCPAVFTPHFGGFCAGGSLGAPMGRITAGNGAGFMFTNSRTLVTDDGSSYNFAPINFYQTPNTRWDFGAVGHYEVNNHLDVYSRLTFSDNSAVSQLAEVPINQNFTVNFGNPLMSPQERAILFPVGGGSGAGGIYENGTTTAVDPNDTSTFRLRRRQVENGPRATHDDHQAFQIVVGAKGELFEGWTYDVSAQYGRTFWGRVLTGDANGTKFQQALLVEGPPGAPTCIDTSNGCVPADIFNGPGGISAASAAFFGTQLLAIGITQQYDAQGSITGDLGVYGIRSPWATTGVGINFGGEWRREQSTFTPDACLAAPGCSLGFGNSPAQAGSYGAQEGFAELKLPIVEGAYLAQQLELDAGFRYSQYAPGGFVSFKFGGLWQPVDDVRFRTSFVRAVREPNVQNLFSPPQNSAPSGSDPCGANSLHNYVPTAALCLATGVPNLGAVGSNALDCGGQCSSYIKGNPLLAPETGDTFSVGLVVTPTFFSGFTATVDYYDITVRQAIAILPFDTIMDLCYDPANNPTQTVAGAAHDSQGNSFCGPTYINRDNFGTLSSQNGFANQLYGNIGALKTRGIDLVLDYTNDLSVFDIFGNDAGTFDLNLAGTYLMKSAFRPTPDAAEIVCTGQFGTLCGAPAMRWRHNFRATWYTNWDVSVSLNWRYLNLARFDNVVQLGAVDPLDAESPRSTTSTCRAPGTSRTPRAPRRHPEHLRQEAADRRRPQLSGANVDCGNTFPGTYDAIGRTFFLGLSVKS